MEAVLIVLNYNDFETTEKLLKNVKRVNTFGKVIVVDNFSTDNSYEKLKKYRNEKTDVIRTERNGGYAYGNNYGIKYAVKNYNPQIIFISNPDVEISENTVNEVLYFFKKNEKKKNKIGIVTGKMVTTSNANIHPAWRLPTYTNCIWENLIILRKLLHIDGGYYKAEHFNKSVSRVDVVSGAFFAVKTDVILEAGMFDENTFLYGEENILAFKLKEKGYESYILNQYEFLHHHSVSISKSINSMGQKLDLAYESRCLYLEKYLKIQGLKKFFHKITYKIGKFNYLMIKRVMRDRK